MACIAFARVPTLLRQLDKMGKEKKKNSSDNEQYIGTTCLLVPVKRDPHDCFVLIS